MGNKAILSLKKGGIAMSFLKSFLVRIKCPIIIRWVHCLIFYYHVMYFMLHILFLNQKILNSVEINDSKALCCLTSFSVASSWYHTNILTQMVLTACCPQEESLGMNRARLSYCASKPAGLWLEFIVIPFL